MEQDSLAHFLRVTRDVSAGTFLTTFGDAAIIRQKSKVGIEFAERYSVTQTSSGGVKYQYTYRESAGSDTCWISPHQDINIISSKASKALKKALEFRSILKGGGQTAQHSYYTQPTCNTSINTELVLIMRTSGNDDEDECLGSGLFATRTIRTGEQIYVSYSEDISKDGSQHSDADAIAVGAQGHAANKLCQTEPRFVRHRWPARSAATSCLSTNRLQT